LGRWAGGLELTPRGGPARPRLTPRERAERRLGALMLAPAFLLLATVVLYPIARLVRARSSRGPRLTLSPRVASRTLPVGITLYQGEFSFPWPIISAALVIAIVPVCLLIAVFQERVVSGLTAGGIKG